jgi:hypothetical protein
MTNLSGKNRPELQETRLPSGGIFPQETVHAASPINRHNVPAPCEKLPAARNKSSRTPAQNSGPTFEPLFPVSA